MIRFLLLLYFVYDIRAKYSRHVNDATRISMEFKGESKIQGTCYLQYSRSLLLCSCNGDCSSRLTVPYSHYEKVPHNGCKKQGLVLTPRKGDFF